MSRSSPVRPFLGGVAAGALVITLIAAGVLLSAGDAAIALLPTAARPSDTPRPNPTPTPPREAPTARATPTDTPTLVPTGACPRPAGWIDAVVGPGDDLAAMAGRFNIDVVLLQVNNCLTEPTVSPGQVLFVPPLPPTPSPTATAFVPILPPTLCGPPLGWQLYTVRPGDTLSSIARATGTTVQQLMLANCLDTDQIKIGQRLFVPRQPFPTATRPPILTPTPPPSPTVTAGTPTPTLSTIDTPTGTPTPTDTSTPIIIQSPTLSPTVEVTPTDTPSPTPTETISPTPTSPPPTDTATPSATP